MLEEHVKEAREKVYGAMIDKFYVLLERFVAEGKAPEPKDFWELGPRGLLNVMIDRIEEGHAILEQKGNVWFFRFSGTRPFYCSSPFPFHKGIKGDVTGTRVGTADAHEHVRQDIEEADARQLAAVLNRDLARPMVELNLGPRKLYPKITIKRRDEEDLTALAENLQKLVPLGLKVGMSTIRDKYGLPDPAPDEELLHAPGQGPGTDPALPDPAEPPRGRQAAASRRAVAAAAPPAAPGQAMDAVDQAVAEELDGWQPLVDPLLASVRALLEDCLAQGLTFREFQARLPEALAGQDVGPLTEHLAQLAFFARLAGETGVTRGGK